jgi:serine phosphatase RsbU (regulator of sigma subunit)
VNPEGEDLASIELQKKLAALHGRSADDLAKAVEETISEVADTQLSDDVTLVVVSRNASRASS